MNDDIAISKIILALFFFLTIQLNEIAAKEQESCAVLDSSSIYGLPIVEIKSCQDFANQIRMEPIPMVLRKRNRIITEKWKAFVKSLELDELKTSKLKIKLSTANSYTGREFIDTTVGAYLEEESIRWNKGNPLSNETFYLFGNHYGEEWNRFLENYPQIKETFDCITNWNNSFTLSFGLSGSNLGVAFHVSFFFFFFNLIFINFSNLVSRTWIY